MLHWNKKYPDPHTQYQYNSKDIYIDTVGSIFALSYVTARAGVLILKYDTLGELEYKYFWGSPEDMPFDDIPARIFVDSSENIYVSGSTLGFGGEGDHNVFFAGFSQRSPSQPAIFGYNFFLLLGILSVVSILISKKLKKP